MTNKELFFFTGKCLTLDERPEFRNTVIEKINSGQIDWNKFVWLCSNHYILQVIYLKFKSNDLLSELPNSLTKLLKSIYRKNSIRNTAILKQADEITILLNNENIYPLFMKGVGNLISGLYQNIGERLIGDIDFLVSGNDYIKSIEILVGMGYKEPHPDLGYVKPDKHYPRLFRKDVPADIEIHNIPVNLAYSKHFNAEIILKDKEIISAFPGYHVPSDEHKITQNFIHSQLDHLGNQLATVSFRDLYDFYLLANRNNALRFKTPYHQKAQNYFTLAERILDMNQRYSTESTIYTSLFCLRFNLHQQYPVLQSLTNFIINTIYFKIIRNLFRFIFTKNIRPRLLRRIKENFKIHK